MAERTRVDLERTGRVWLEGVPSALVVHAPSVLAGPWMLPLAHLASLTWLSATGAHFRAVLPPRVSTRDDAPVEVVGARRSPDLHLSFDEPMRVPFRRGRTLWPRAVLAWAPPDRLRMYFPPPSVRQGLATSLVLWAVQDRMVLLELLEDVGLEFPAYGDPS
jgi:hypothetical protein